MSMYPKSTENFMNR